MIIQPLLKPQIITPASDLLTDLISCWELDETSGLIAYDSHAANDGTNVSCAVNQTGKVGSAYSFDGTTSQINITAASDFAGIPHASLSIWVYVGTLPTTNAYWIMLSKLLNSWVSPYYHFQIRMLFGAYRRFELSFGTTTGWDTIVSGAIINANNWYHSVGTYDGGTGVVKLYVNGAFIATKTIPGGGNIGSVASPVVIGDDNDIYANFKNWTGLIDQTAVWRRPLTAAEVTALYNSGNGLSYSNW